MQAARAAAKTSAAAAKAAAKGAAAAVKAAVATVKALAAAIAAGGWVAVLVIVLICMAAAVLGSCFGIFFVVDDGGGMTLQSVMQEVQDGFDEEWGAVVQENPHDELEVSGELAPWKDVLAIYAVAAAAPQPDRYMDVITMDAERAQLLEEIFRQMNAFTWELSTYTETAAEGAANEQEETDLPESEVTKTRLRIGFEHKTAEEAAALMRFDSRQKELLAEMLREDYDELWAQLTMDSAPRG